MSGILKRMRAMVGASSKMCEDEVQSINDHTDRVGEAMHFEHGELVRELRDLEEKLHTKVEHEISEVKREFKTDLHGVRQGVSDLQKSVGGSFLKYTGITCTVLVTLFGLMFNWMWGQEQMRDQLSLERAAVIGETIANQNAVADDVGEIKDLLKQEIKREKDRHDKEMENHLKYDHGQEPGSGG